MPRDSLIRFITQFFKGMRFDGKKLCIDAYESRYAIMSVRENGYSSPVVEYKSQVTGKVYYTLLNQFSTYFLESVCCAIQNIDTDRNLF